MKKILLFTFLLVLSPLLQGATVIYNLTLNVQPAVPPSYVGATFAYSASGSGATCAPAIPTGTQPKDLMLAYIVTESTTPPAAPSGWAIAQVGGSNITVVNGTVASSTLYYRYFVSGDAAPSFTGLSYPGCVLRSYRNAAPSPPFIDAFQTCVQTGATGGGHGGTSCTIPALANTTVANELTVGFWNVDQEGVTNTMSGPSSMGNAFTTWEADRAFWVGDQALPSAGSTTGALTASVTGIADLWQAISLTLLPGVQTPSAPVFASGNPASQTAAVGATVTFTSSVTGSPAPTCQWYKNGASLGSGATSCSSLTYPLSGTLVAGDNGDTFYNVAANSQGTAQSQMATLTVTTATSQTFYLGLPVPPPTPNNKKAVAALAFNTSIGANVCGNSSCCSTCGQSTGSISGDAAMIGFIGVKTLRARTDNPSWLIQIAQPNGAGYCILGDEITGPGDILTGQGAIAKQLITAGVYRCWEGMNEPNTECHSYNGQPVSNPGGPGNCNSNTNGSDWRPAAQFLYDVYNAIQGDATLKNYMFAGISDTGAEYGNYGIQFTGPVGIPSGGGGTNGVFPAGTIFSQAGVQHNYNSGTAFCPGGSCPANTYWNAADPCINQNGYVFYQDYESTWANHYAGLTQTQSCDVITYPRITTEWNSSNANNTEAQGVRVVDSYIDYFNRGIRVSELFAMISGCGSNQIANTEGFYTCGNTTTPNPSGNYTHSLTHFMADTGDVITPGTINWSFGSGCPNAGDGQSLCHGLLVQKSSQAAYNPNTYVLLMTFEPAYGAGGITLPVNFGQQITHARVYDATTVVSPSQNLPSSPPTVAQCDNCSSINISWAATGVHAGNLPPPLLLEMTP